MSPELLLLAFMLGSLATLCVCWLVERVTDHPSPLTDTRDMLDEVLNEPRREIRFTAGGVELRLERPEEL